MSPKREKFICLEPDLSAEDKITFDHLSLFLPDLVFFKLGEWAVAHFDQTKGLPSVNYKFEEEDDEIPSKEDVFDKPKRSIEF